MNATKIIDGNWEPAVNDIAIVLSGSEYSGKITIDDSVTGVVAGPGADNTSLAKNYFKRDSLWRRFFSKGSRSLVMIVGKEQELEVISNSIPSYGEVLVSAGLVVKLHVVDYELFTRTVMINRKNLDKNEMSQMVGALVHDILAAQTLNYLSRDLCDREDIVNSIEESTRNEFAGVLLKRGIQLDDYKLSRFEISTADNEESQTSLEAWHNSVEREDISEVGLEPYWADTDSSLLALRLVAIAAGFTGLTISVLSNQMLTDRVRIIILSLAVIAVLVVIFEAVRLKIAFNRRNHRPNKLSKKQQHKILIQSDIIIRRRVREDFTQIQQDLRLAATGICKQSDIDNAKIIAMEFRNMASSLETIVNRISGAPELNDKHFHLLGHDCPIEAMKMLNEKLFQLSESLKGLSRMIVQDSDAGAVEEFEPNVDKFKVLTREIEDTVKKRDAHIRA
jgi:hypothetical protein